jgi:endonuclease/exonuclease/phosphatase family metal-dependent hydrolase
MDAETTMRVMTFNIRGATYDDEENIWEKRADLNVRTILNAQPDVIGFQECQTGNMDVYRTALTDYDFVQGMPYNRPKRLFYHAIFWRKGRLEYVGDGGFYLSQTPTFWSKDWDAARIHALGWARFRCLKTQACFLFMNTHLDHMSHRARLESGRLIVSRLDTLAADGEPIVFGGDFNSPPYLEGAEAETVHRCFLQAGFRDTYLERHVADRRVKTVHGFRGGCLVAEDSERAPRVDWILVRDGVRKVRVLGCEIVCDAEPPLYPSDHYPVIADVCLGC